MIHIKNLSLVWKKNLEYTVKIKANPQPHEKLLGCRRQEPLASAVPVNFFSAALLQVAYETAHLNDKLRWLDYCTVIVTSLITLSTSYSLAEAVRSF